MADAFLFRRGWAIILLNVAYYVNVILVRTTTFPAKVTPVCENRDVKGKG